MDYASLKAQNRALNREEILAGATTIQSRPLYFWFDLHGPCNLECKHCGFQIYGRTSDKDVSEKVYETILNEIMPTAYVCNLGGANWGEMTIGKSFHRFLLDCKKFGVKVNLTTNGTRMTDEWFDDLLDVLTVIGFSMEGMEEQFEAIRGFKWRFFLKHVEKVIRGRADRGKDFRIEWRFCAHADNIHQLPAMIRLAKSIGVDKIQVMNLVPYVADQKFKNLYYHRSLANQCFAEARKVAEELDFHINVPPDFNNGAWECKSNLVQLGGLNGKPLVQTSELEMINCYYPWQACAINETGTVRPCCIYWRDVGDISKTSFAAVWNGRKYRKLRAGVNRKPDAICHSCRMPRFDSDQNTSASQLMPSLRQVLRNALTIKREKITFAGVMNEEFDPAREIPAGNDLAGTASGPAQ